jgi:hypothetical protein
MNLSRPRVDPTQTGRKPQAASDLFNLSDTQALDYARARAAEFVGKKWIDGQLVDNPDSRWAISETTRLELRGLIAQAFEKCWTPTQLARQIEKAFDFPPDRAKMIAQTETAMANTAATVQTGKKLGATTKSIQMSNLHNVRDECDDAFEAGDVPIDKPFPNGSMHVPLHPGCRCVELVHMRNPSEDDDGDSVAKPFLGDY